MARRIVVLGPLPPPFGGVSLHIVRFLELLKAEGVAARALPYTGITRRGRAAKVLQAAKMLLAINLRAWSPSGAVLHIHYGGLGYFLALTPLLAISRARKVITFHSVRVLQDLERRPGWVRRFALSLLDRFALFVAVRGEIGDALRTLGLDGPEVTVMPAFLPPAPAEQDLSRLPPAMAADLVAAQNAGRIQICCGAYYLGPGYGHDDIYGVERLLGALGGCASLPQGGLDLWVLVSNRPQSTEQLRAEAAVLAAAAGLATVRLHLHFGRPLMPVMSRCSGFVRPSSEDGDSVAIREALALGLPVLASDVVARPPGVRVYPSGSGLPRALESFLAALTPTPPGGARPIQAPDAELYRGFVEVVCGRAAAR